ncbi:hypothetical protein AB0L82_35450 [Nocardia sp. NPDC052001]|uniref:hypothetical protein n=1 Tax=Nocardia sp. NPDC052001 TaxID=3154853 RepID=UPI00341D42C7
MPIASLLAQGIWPLLVFFGLVLVVSVIALIRAEKKDVPAIFKAFAEAFGFHSGTLEKTTEMVETGGTGNELVTGSNPDHTIESDDNEGESDEEIL